VPAQYRIRSVLAVQPKKGGGNRGNTSLKTKMMAIIVLGIGSLYALRTASLLAQAKPAANAPGEQKLGEQAMRGQGLFLQRCSLCHLPRKLKFGSPAVIGPSLSGQFKNATPDQLKILRGFILKGGPDMPGFQYGLEPREVDDVIAYLKTQ
jgi:mono/diheme cytochrome c family protein